MRMWTAGWKEKDDHSLMARAGWALEDLKGLEEILLEYCRGRIRMQVGDITG